MQNKIFLTFILISFSFFGKAQTGYINFNKSNKWVDSIFNKLSLDEKIAQLMTIAVWTQRDSNYFKEVDKLVADYKIGGVMFMKGTPHKQAVLTNRFQKLAKVPLLVSIDGEWGLSMRLDSTPTFPRQMVLGAANNTELTRQMAAEIAKHCNRMGIHVNFAPVVDINNNAANPVINDRSFGENKYIVAKHGIAYAKGLQENKVIACAKHFPGHGDTETDSHHALPFIPYNFKRLDSLELYPFRELIDNKVASIMVGHLYVPAIDSVGNIATSISKNAVTGLLKKELGFDGLIVTDGLNMKGVANYVGPGEVCAKALEAGNDLLLFVEDVPDGIKCIKEYINSGKISMEQLNNSCKKILMAKYWCGLNNYKPIDLVNLYDDLNCCSTDLMIKKVIKNAIVVAKNQDNLIPFAEPNEYKVLSLAVGNSKFTDFQQMLNNYLKADYLSIDKNESKEKFDSLFIKTQYYNLIILSLHSTSRFVSRKLGLTQNQIEFVKRVLTSNKCILVNHGNPYILQHFKDARNVVLAYEDLPVYNQLAAQVLMGAIPAKGQMPVSVTDAYPLASGIKTQTLNRFEYVMPEEVGYNHVPFALIDSLVQKGIKNKAMPGCQIVVAKNGKVVYNKSFGKFTYDSLSQDVQNYHIYDLASLTKILATTLAVMKLFEEGKLKLSDKLGLYLPELRGTAKDRIAIKDVLLHQAGFVPYIPFYKNTLTKNKPDTLFYSKTYSEKFNLKVADSLYAVSNIYDYVIKNIAQSELNNQGQYTYTDLGFILLKKVVEVITNTPFEKYVDENFYKPLNLANTTYNPLEKGISKNMIAPTESDNYFRQQLLRGYVHDQTAAMIGGVSGHAGLFANANDVAVIMQMLLNGGEYGNVRIFKPSTVEIFTKKQSKTGRRGLGFDKPETQPNLPSPTGKNCSPLTFGHTGFTGTCTWADPKNNLVYVFLSNRVYPSAENNKLAQMNIRTEIQDLLYEIMKQ
ncbi:MAG: glycoside hydrolase family 3 N-terminal domain-containing protein [Bacteroidia bacterium]